MLRSPWSVTLGYIVLFRWSPSDAIYMTVITLTTVGFREVHELDRVPGTAVDDDPRSGGRRDHLRVHRHRGRDDHQRGRERPAGGEADAGVGGRAAGPLHRLRLWAGRIHGGGASWSTRASASSSSTSTPPRWSTPPATGTWWSRAMRPTTRPCAGAGVGRRPGPGHHDRLRREQRLRHALGARDQRPAVHRRACQCRGVRGQAGAGRRQPRGLAVHDGRAPDRGAGQPSPGGRTSSMPRSRTGTSPSRWRRWRWTQRARCWA